MPSSELRRIASTLSLVLASTLSSVASAQEQEAQGFAVDRISTPVPGSSWLVNDSLDMHGELGGTIGVSFAYAHDALRVPSAIVSDRAVAAIGMAATYERLRLSLAFEAPFVMRGENGTANGYTFTAPDVDPGSHPDTLSDVRLGLDARLVGEADGPLRLGAGAQLFVPSGERRDYVTDDTYRALGRVLLAGDLAHAFSYAAFVGLHLRPLDDREVPESPRGSELVASAAAGPQFAIGTTSSIGVGPELYAASAFAALLQKRRTAVEGLVSGRLDTRLDGATLRVKLGAGAGLHAHFGAPEWRSIVSIEVTGHVK